VRVLMLFVDGVGIGRKDPAVNPMFAARLPALRSMLDGELPSLRRRAASGRMATLIPLDATMGVPGLPQSGTGQTALFTGVNAPKLAGIHFGPYPHSSLRPVLQQKNIFRQVLSRSLQPWFANAYPQRFFDYIGERPSRITATSYSALASGMRLLNVTDLMSGSGISADITNESWSGLGYPEVDVIEPEEAGRRLARLASRFDFVLFEYWKTDHAGHSRHMGEAVRALERLDAMLLGILEGLNASETLLFISSDHGNIEDLSTKTHTRNPVPALFYGRGHAEAARALQMAAARSPSLVHVTPVLLNILSGRPE